MDNEKTESNKANNTYHQSSGQCFLIYGDGVDWNGQIDLKFDCHSCNETRVIKKINPSTEVVDHDNRAQKPLTFEKDYTCPCGSEYSFSFDLHNVNGKEISITATVDHKDWEFYVAYNI